MRRPYHVRPGRRNIGRKIRKIPNGPRAMGEGHDCRPPTSPGDEGLRCRVVGEGAGALGRDEAGKCSHQPRGRRTCRPCHAPTPADPSSTLRLHPARRILRDHLYPKPGLSVRRSRGRRDAVERYRRSCTCDVGANPHPCPPGGNGCLGRHAQSCAWHYLHRGVRHRGLTKHKDISDRRGDACVAPTTSVRAAETFSWCNRWFIQIRCFQAHQRIATLPRRADLATQLLRTRHPG